jgi:hypothetical protein
MKISFLIIFGMFCLFNVDFSNSSPSPLSSNDYYGGVDASYDTSDYDSYDYNYGNESEFSLDSGDCPPNCQRPKSPKCKRRQAACQKKPSNGTNSSPNGGGSGQKGGDCPPKCQRPNSPKCKRRQDACKQSIVNPVNPPQNPVNPGGDCLPKCKCSGKTFVGPLALPFGHCQTKNPGSKNFYCYVDANSSCPDKKQSGRQQNLFWSEKACDFERACGILAADGVEYPYPEYDTEEYVYFDEEISAYDTDEYEYDHY